MIVTMKAEIFGIGVFSGRTLSSLSAESEYKVRAFATNTNGTGYGDVQTFWTLSNEPANHTLSFTATAISANDIDLSFDAANTITKC
jgi:FlaG/FlaF family flagellin (archaellin)